MKNQLQNVFLLFIVILITGIITSCTADTLIKLPESVNTPVLKTEPTQMHATQTLMPSHTPTPIFTATLLPSPTSTPRSHSVKLGETLGGIALIYNVSLDSILKINPEVNPNTMTVGMTILIPAETQVPGNQTPFPTPIVMPVTNLHCSSDSIQGVWCFGTIENVSDSIQESVVINVNLADQQATALFSQKALLPLNVLFPGEKLPFAVYFSPIMPDPFQFSAQFSSSIPIDDSINQYRRVEISDQQYVVNSSGFAQVKGSYELPENTSKIWILGVGFNESGEIIGIRKWESTESDAGSFDFNIYAASGQITDVQIFAEAQP